MVAARFLTIFLVLLPLALWGTLGESWNHWATIPAEFIIAFFLFGIEEVSSTTSVEVVVYNVFSLQDTQSLVQTIPTLPQLRPTLLNVHE